MQRYWLCWVENTGGGQHYRHYSLGEAQAEAERLARLPNVNGKTVSLFECIGRCQIEEMPIKWEVPR